MKIKWGGEKKFSQNGTQDWKVVKSNREVWEEKLWEEIFNEYEGGKMEIWKRLQLLQEVPVELDSRHH